MDRCIPVILCLTLAGVSNAADEPKAPTVKEPELRAELLRRAKTDQDVRAAVGKWMMQFGASLYCAYSMPPDTVASFFLLGSNFAHGTRSSAHQPGRSQALR